MLYLIMKAAVSGVVIAIASEVARRYPGVGALIVSLPLVSILAMLWLWQDTHDTQRMVHHVEATFWYVLPSMPMFLLMPFLMRQGVSFWMALGAGCVLTIGLYLLLIWLAPRLGLRL